MDSLREAHRQLLASSLLTFTKKMFYANTKHEYIVGRHHIMICDALERVVRGDCKRLIINIAPRYGKTELVSRMFMAWCYALNPACRFLHLSYSGGLTVSNSVAVKDTILSPYFQYCFDARIRWNDNSKARWSTIQDGEMYATSTLGQITGFGAGSVQKPNLEEDAFQRRFNPKGFTGAIVIDDPLKPDEALSDNIRETINLRFETTIRNRVNSRDVPIIVIMQRLHEHDLCGYLLEAEPDQWEVLSIPTIMLGENGEPEALWDFKHSLSELEQLRLVNPFVFETQYMQNPKPLEGLMYANLRTYEAMPIEVGVRKNYTDTADTGADYCCSVCYYETPTGMYVTDVLYTKKPMEFTEPKTAEMLVRNKTQIVKVESNNGGRGFCRNVEKNVRLLGGVASQSMSFQSFQQTGNKQVRIFSHSAEVQNLIFFPQGWEVLWPQFAQAVKAYRKEGRNAHDDAPDVLTGMVENFRHGLTGSSMRAKVSTFGNENK